MPATLFAIGKLNSGIKYFSLRGIIILPNKAEKHPVMKKQLTLFFLCCSCFNYLHAQSKEVYLQLKWWHQFQFAGYYAADIKGFYKEEGLNVRIIAGDKDHPPVKQVLEGKANFGITGSDLIVNYANGDPVKVIGAIFQHSPYVFISRKEKNIVSPTDLIGKTVMASEDQGWVQLKAMLIKEGINTASIKIDPHTWNNEDLINGKADAMTGYVSVETYQLEKKGIPVNYIQPINYGIDFYGDVLFCTNDLANKSPELVNRFSYASYKGWEYAMGHINEMADYILTLPGVKERGITKEALLYEAEAMKKLILPELVEIGHMNEGRWQHILDIHKSLKIVPENISLKGFVFDPMEKRNADLYNWIIIALIIVSLFMLFAFLYGYNLKNAVKKRTLELTNEINIRRDTEDKLKISEERLELAIAAAGLGIWDWDVQRNEIYFSSELKAMLGYGPAELADTIESFMYLLHPDHNHEINQKLNDHIYNKRDNYDAIVRLKMKDGNWKWVLIMSKALIRDEQGRALRLTGIHLDVDKIKKKEIELSHLTDELMHTNRDLQQFAYITSHNLRAPVANLLSLIMFFDRAEFSENNDSLFEKVDLCVQKLNQTLNDVNEVLTSRVSKANQFEELVFEKEVNSILASISEEVASTRTSVIANYEVPTIQYSRKVMDSILINLVTNAIKYRKKDVDPIIHIHTYLEAENIVLSVKDNGIGINLERHGNKIFGLYQRFNADVDGKGMGLFLIKNQIEALHDSISVSSIPNEGSNFTIRFKKQDLHG